MFISKKDFEKLNDRVAFLENFFVSDQQFDNLEAKLENKFDAIEKYLGIKYVIEESKFEGYKSTKNPKTNKKPVI